MSDSYVKLLKDMRDSGVKKVAEFSKSLDAIKRDMSSERVSNTVARVNRLVNDMEDFYIGTMSGMNSCLLDVCDRVTNLERRMDSLNESDTTDSKVEEVKTEERISEKSLRYKFFKSDAVEQFHNLLNIFENGINEITGCAVYNYCYAGSEPERAGIIGTGLVFTGVDFVDERTSDAISSELGSIIMGSDQNVLDLSSGELTVRWCKLRTKLLLENYPMRRMIVERIVDVCADTAIKVFETREHIGYVNKEISNLSVGIVFAKGFWNDFFINLGMDLGLDE